MLIVCRKIIISRPEVLSAKGPLLIAANHPNSFLDAVIFDILFDQPIWSLARGDVFRKKWVARVLLAMKIFPVYRSSEGAENLSFNYQTFEDCIRLFRNKGIVLIFSEGKCVNEWHLRPLKKGTARLAIRAWNEGIPLQVLPAGINYSSFRRFGKNVFINFGNVITPAGITDTDPEGKKNKDFNDRLRAELEGLVYEIPAADKATQKSKLFIFQPFLKKVLLAVPAFAGMLIHAPFYLPVKRLVLKRFNHNDHYDSMIAGILILSYPLFLLLLTLLVFLLTSSAMSLLALPILPLTAWSFVQLKDQLDK